MMRIEEIERPLLGDDLINFIFLGGLLLLIISKLLLVPKNNPVFRLSSIPSENENFTLYTAICSLIYTIFLALILLPFFDVTIPFYNTQVARLLILLTLLSSYQIFSYVFSSLFFFFLGRSEEYNENYKNRFIFLFIKLAIAILLCFIIYYTKFPQKYSIYLIVSAIGLLLVSEWIWLMFFH